MGTSQYEVKGFHLFSTLPAHTPIQDATMRLDPSVEISTNRLLTLYQRSTASCKSSRANSSSTASRGVKTPSNCRAQPAAQLHRLLHPLPLRLRHRYPARPRRADIPWRAPRPGLVRAGLGHQATTLRYVSIRTGVIDGKEEESQETRIDNTTLI